MATKLKRLTVYCSAEEKLLLARKLEESGENISNHFRKLEGWKPLTLGPPKGNRNAVKKDTKRRK